MPRLRTVLPPDERRRQILAAAILVFARKGYRRSGISDVIAQAGIARGTFYLHFESKEQLFLAIVEDFHDRVAAAFDEWDQHTPGSAPVEVLAARLRHLLGFFAGSREQAQVVLREASSIDPRFEQGYAELRQSAIEAFARQANIAGPAGSSRRSEVVAHLQLGMLEEVVNAYVLKDPDADIAQLAQDLAEFAWYGLGGRPT
jgi:AcrR family transcriptional regulator